MIKLLIRYFKDIGIRVDPFDLEKKLSDHPMPNTVRCISDVMDAYNVSNIACELSREQLLELAPPYIAMIDTQKESFCIVERVSLEKLEVYSAISGRQSIKQDNFIGIWKGIVIAGESGNDTRTGSYVLHAIKMFLWNIKRNLVPILCLLSAYILMFKFIGNKTITLDAIIFTIIKFVGLIVSILIIYKMVYAPLFFEKFCTSTKKADCNNIFQSKAAKILGFVGLGELSLAYFGGTLFWGIFLSSSPISIYIILSFAASLFLIYSLSWQLVHKSICPLCLLLDFIIAFELFISIYILTKGDSNALIFTDIFNACVCIVILLFVTMLIIESSITKKTLFAHKERASQIIYSQNVFHSVILQSTIIQESSSFNPLSNNCNGDNEITLVLSLSCSHCYNAFQSISNIKNNRINIMLHVDDEETNISHIPLGIVSQYLYNGWNGLIKVLTYWYEHQRLPDDIKISADAINILRDHKKFCSDIESLFTPLIIVNGHIVPNFYKPEDIPFMI